MKIGLTILALASCISTFAIETRCGGGDGPKPVENFVYKTELVDTKGGVKDFQFLPTNQKVIFKSGASDLRSAELVAGVKGANFGAMNPTDDLSAIVDPGERYVPIDGKWKVYDLVKKVWQDSKVIPASGTLVHLYIQGDNLYSVASVKDKDKRYTFYRYSLSRNQVYKTCTIKEQKQVPLYLVNGQKYPEVQFYSNNPLEDGKSLLATYRLDVTNCALVESPESVAVLRSPLQSVHYFPEQKSYGVHVDHAKENFLWATGDSCRYFNIDNADPIVPNYNFPILVTKHPEQGLNLIFLSKEKPDEARATRLLGDFPAMSLRARDVILNNRQQMLLAPQFANEKSRWLFQVKLGNVKAEGL